MMDEAKPLSELINRQLRETSTAPLAGGRSIWPDTLRIRRSNTKKLPITQPEVETKAAE